MASRSGVKGEWGETSVSIVSLAKRMKAEFVKTMTREHTIVQKWLALTGMSKR